MESLAERATVESFRHAGAPRPAGSIALDQWRGLALVFVLISHGFFFTNHVAGAGRMGVNLFFFISGILVFRSLASSRDKGWRMPVMFWWRRLRRLYPALLAYLALMLVLLPVLQHIPTGLANSDFASFVHTLPLALSYLVDYARDVPPTMGHLWSLSVEVQFYLLAPIIFLLGRGSRVRQRWTYGVILLVAIVYGSVYPLRAAHLEAVRYRFEVAAWPMMLGFYCEFAKLQLLRVRMAVVKVIFYAGVAAIPVSLLVMTALPGAKLLVIAMGSFLLLPCLCAYLFGLAFRGSVGTVLVWVGERTYSTYLLQQPLTLARYLPFALHPLAALASPMFGSVWFAYFERPFLSTNRAKQIQSAQVEGKVAEIQADTALSGVQSQATGDASVRQT